jgi:diguanylate cyclase (GGDEF)-like protein
MLRLEHTADLLRKREPLIRASSASHCENRSCNTTTGAEALQRSKTPDGHKRKCNWPPFHTIYDRRIPLNWNLRNLFDPIDAMVAYDYHLAQSANPGLDHECHKQSHGWLLVDSVFPSAKTRLAPFRKLLLSLAALSVLFVLLASLGTPQLLAEAPADTAAAHPPLLTTASQVHELPAELASRARVQIFGVVTYYDPGEHNLFIQDKSGGVYIDLDKAYPLHYGDYVSVQGLAWASYRTEVATDPKINVLSRNHRVPAPRVTYRELATGQMDCRLVKVTGKVRAVNVEQHENSPILHLDVSMHGGEIEVYQPFPIEPDKRESFGTLEALPLLDSTVEIEGVAGGAFDTKSQLTGLIVYAQQRSGIRILKRSMVNALELPLSDIDTVFESRHIDDASTRLRLRGTLTYYKKGEAVVLEQDGKSVFVQTREDKAIPLGDVVDALGFAGDQEYGPSLREALLFDTHTRNEIAARAVGYAEALSGIDSDNLVSLEGLLVSQLRNRSVETLVIDVNGNFVTGRLEHTLPVQHIRIGSRLRLTGICRIVPGGSWQAPSFFHIEMRSPDDVVVLSSPSWWTVRHLVELLGTLGALALVISAWAVLLRRRVRQQTESIELSMTIARTRSALLETISIHKTAESWLKEFCEKVRILLPGTGCSFLFGGESLEQPFFVRASLTSQTLLHTASLRDTEGKEVGHIQVFNTGPCSFGANQQEVCLMLAEVANLAMQQSLLYQGLVHHSTHDPLTDLPNRRLCEQRLQDALKEAAETNGRVTVVYIDVDRFKDINDRYGHKTGDSYLKHISGRLRSAIRTIDTLARVGGDEFLVIVPQKSSDTDFISLQERLHACFQQRFEVEGHRFKGSASLGLASFPEDGATADELKRHADQAMYVAKRKASSVDNKRTVPQFAILTPKELERAFERKQLTLSYQPQFSADGTLQGLEALLRLQDPILGTVTPDAFISVAERCEVILHLGRWVLESAVRSAVAWGLHKGIAVLLSVNVAPLQIAESEFAGMVLSVIERNGFPANRLELELTERSFGTDSDEALRQVQRLREAGIRIAIDDFGTGYSALSLLHRLPVDTIKIDRSFIMAMEKEPNVLSIIEAISFMARSLGKRIVAEGIEKSSSLAALLQMGPMDYQGYLLSRPIDSSKVKDALREWRSGISMPMALDRKDS